MPEIDDDIAALLRWHLDIGVDETIGDEPHDWFHASSETDQAAALAGPAPASPPAGTSPQDTPPPTGERRAAPERRANPPPTGSAPSSASSSLRSADARLLVADDAALRAARSATLDDLRAEVAAFDGCPLRRTATNLVFGMGDSTARVVLIGEAPGAEEDRQGLPFVGPSGRLLDKMLASIGLHREEVFITNTVFWRPPGNRSPTSGEIVACQPFVERILEIIQPRLLVALGGPAANSLLRQNDSVGRLRGRWFEFSTPHMQTIAATAIFHPAYLLRSPGQKRLAWRDLLAIKAKLDSN